MALLFPTIIFDKAYDITVDYLKDNGITTLLLDVDNTLTVHGSQHLPPKIDEWLKTMHDNNIKMIIVSNNIEKRVEPFAKTINLPYLAFCCKPSVHGFARACKKLGVSKNEVALVGDQIFTDILGANFYSIKSILVIPMKGDHKLTIKFKRYLEKFVLKSYFKKGGKMLPTKEQI